MAREGRGWLSSLDLVPEVGRPAVEWADAELDRRDRVQSEILEELNERLAAAGVDAISRSAFNRHALRRALKQDARDWKLSLNGVADQFSGKDVDDSNLVVGEMIKSILWAAIQARGEEIDAKTAGEIARGYRHVVAAQLLSAQQRAKREQEFELKAEAAIDNVAKATGLTTDQAARLRSEILGVRPKETQGG
jgi:hypothetical protein